MGNWRRVQIIGTCGDADLPALKQALDPGRDYDNFHCLVNGGLCGLPNWAKPSISAIGNLAERNYGPKDVAETLTTLREKAPSLRAKVHCGDDYESDVCIATVTLADDAVATVGDPEIPQIGAISDAQIQTSLLEQLTRR